MSTGVVSVRVPVELKTRLDQLSAATGRSAAFYVREALTEHLDGLEYAYALRSEVEANRRGELDSTPLDDLVAELDL